MRLSKWLALGTLPASLVLLLSGTSFASAIIPGTFNFVTPLTGNDGTFSFIASVDSAAYAPGTNPYAFAAPAGDWVYAYQVTSTGFVPGTTADAIDLLSVAAGAPVDLTGEISNATPPANTATGTITLTSGSVLFNFGGVLPGGPISPILLFASPNIPSLQSAFAGDHGVDSNNGLVVSEGPTPPGLPLPVPAAAWGGLGLFGLLALGKLRKMVAAA